MTLASKLSARWARIYQQPVDKFACLQADLTTTTGNCGYWTSSPSALSSNHAWLVDYDGEMIDNGTVNNPNRGVRLVISVLKSDVL